MKTIKIFVFSRYNRKEIEKELIKHGIKISKSPDFVFAYGGDGTILEAERRFPGIPKIPIKYSRICAKCNGYNIKAIGRIAEKLKEGKYKIKEYEKIEGIFKKKKITGLNEIQIHNAKPCVALRFSLSVGNKKFNEVIGDGIIVSTSYGSTAYFNAMGYKPFKKGLKLAFNNCKPKSAPIQLQGTARVKIMREKAFLITDNCKKMIKLAPGDAVLIKKSKEKARFAEI